MENPRSIRSIFPVALVAAGVCLGAWSQSVQVFAQPAAPSGEVTIITQTTPAAQPAYIRHEAVMDSSGNIVDLIVVKTAPPEPKKEVVRIETRPAENAVWVPGYWQWNADNANYDWVPGTWRHAIPGMKWNAGHWVKVSNGYEWMPGFWTSESPASAATETTSTRTLVVEAPPAPKEESRPASPEADMVWIPGNWTYEKGQYVWNAGRWERPVAESMIWTPGRWFHTTEGYRYVSGHWDYPAQSRAYVVSP